MTDYINAKDIGYNERARLAKLGVQEGDMVPIRHKVVHPMFCRFLQLAAEQPKAMSDTPQRPALMCFLILRGHSDVKEGVLSTTPEGLMKFAMSATTAKGAPPMLVEMFIGIDDVVSIAVPRKVEAAPASKLWTPGQS